MKIDYTEIKTSLEMTESLKETLLLNGDNISLYALKLIEELEDKTNESSGDIGLEFDVSNGIGLEYEFEKYGIGVESSMTIEEIREYADGLIQALNESSEDITKKEQEIDKAKYLIDKYGLVIAPMVCDEIIEQWEYIDTYLADFGGELNPNLRYWYDVKKQIKEIKNKL